MSQPPIRERLKDLNTKAYYLLVALSFIYRSSSAAWALKSAFILTAVVAVLPVQDWFVSPLWLKRIRDGKRYLLIAALACVLIWIFSPAAVSQNSSHETAKSAETQLAPHWYQNPEWILVIVGTITFAFIGWQSAETRRAARAAEKAIGPATQSAQAAFRNASALINSERAWVMDDLYFQPNQTVVFVESRGIGQEPFDGSAVEVVLKCRNAGRSPALVIQKQVRMAIVEVESLPRSPEFNHPDFIFNVTPEPLAPGEQGDPNVFRLACNGRPASDTVSIVYGRILYDDIFGGNRETTFAYTFDTSRVIGRLSGYPEYNKHT